MSKIQCAYFEERPLKMFSDPKYMSVITRVLGKDIIIETRVCDIYNFKAQKWLVKHINWASRHGHSVEIHKAEPEEVAGYVARQTEQLARKFK